MDQIGGIFADFNLYFKDFDLYFKDFYFYSRTLTYICGFGHLGGILEASGRHPPAQGDLSHVSS